MAKLVIRNLTESKKLDRNTMKTVSGGMRPSSVSGSSFGVMDVTRVPGSSGPIAIPYPNSGAIGTATKKALKAVAPKAAVGSFTTESGDVAEGVVSSVISPVVFAGYVE